MSSRSAWLGEVAIGRSPFCIGTESTLYMHDALIQFDDMGILRATHIPPKLLWLQSAHIELLLAVLNCGSDGLPRRRTRKFNEARADALRQLELRDLVQWERDRRGKLAFVCLTWKGEEAAQLVLKVAHHEQALPTEQ